MNKKEPYGEIFGQIDDAPGARFMQNGEYFNAQGNKVGGKFSEPVEVTIELDPEPESITISLEPEVDENGKVDNVDLSNVHHKTLKKMVVDAGGEYTNKADAIEFLSNG